MTNGVLFALNIFIARSDIRTQAGTNEVCAVWIGLGLPGTVFLSLASSDEDREHEPVKNTCTHTGVVEKVEPCRFHSSNKQTSNRPKLHADLYV